MAIWNPSLPERGTRTANEFEDIVRELNQRVHDRLKKIITLGEQNEDNDGFALEGRFPIFVRIKGQAGSSGEGGTGEFPIPLPDRMKVQSGFLLLRLEEDGKKGNVYYWNHSLSEDRHEGELNTFKWTPLPLAFLTASARRVFAPGLFIPGLIRQGIVGIRVNVPPLSAAKLTAIIVDPGRIVTDVPAERKIATRLAFTKNGTVIQVGGVDVNISIPADSTNTQPFVFPEKEQVEIGNYLISERRRDRLGVTVVDAGPHADMTVSFEGYDNLIVPV